MNLRKDHYREVPPAVRGGRIGPENRERETRGGVGSVGSARTCRRCDARRRRSRGCRRNLGVGRGGGPGPVVVEGSPSRDGERRTSKVGLPPGASPGPSRATSLPRRRAIGKPCTAFFSFFLSFPACRELGWGASAGRRLGPSVVGRAATTSNGGPLGSCFDEERRELRYLV